MIFRSAQNYFVNSRVLTVLFNRKAFLSSQSECVRSAFRDIEIPETTIPEFVLKNVGKWTNKIALECGLTGRKYTYNQVQQRSINFSKSLRGILKLQKHDVVAIHLPNIPEFPICALGIFFGGLTITTINPIYTADEIAKQLQDSDTKLVITLNDGYQNCVNAVEQLKKNMLFVVIKTKQNESLPNNCIDFEYLSTNSIETQYEPSGFDEVVHLPYSSGTTGLPKGVMLTNKNIIASVMQVNAPECAVVQECTGDNQDILPCVLPMFHIYGFTLCMLALLEKGCKLVTIPKFRPDSFLNILKTHKPTVMQLVPPILLFLNTHEAMKKEYLENIRAILCGAAPLGALDEEKFKEKIGKPVDIFQGYGLTETAPSILQTPKTQFGRFPGSIGHPLSNTQLKIVEIDDPEIKHLGPNRVGELLVKGPQVMKGYLGRPEETEKAFVNGWFRTGDLGRYNESEMFYIEDRIKELIKVKGFQVAPAELEELIRSYEGVAEAAVIGIPDKYAGELPRAYVVPKKGYQFNVDDLKNYVHDKVAPYKKLIGGVAVVDSIPKTASGKILRRELKREYEANKRDVRR